MRRCLLLSLTLVSGWSSCAFAATTTQPPAAALAAVIAGAKASHTDALLVLRDGKPLVTYYRNGRDPGPIEMMSATKSIVALGIGRLIAEGKLKSMDTPAYRFYPQWKQGEKQKITVRMLLNMTSGLQNVPNTSVEIYPAPDAIKLALAAGLSNAPGTHFSYNNKAVNLLAGIIDKASGEPMDEFLQRELFSPMGIPPTPWDDRDKAGNPYAMDGWKATATAAAQIGELVLAGGNWRGKQLIAEGYIKEMLSQSQPFTVKYGLLWWRDPAWQRYHVDAKSFTMMRNGGASLAFIAKLEPLSGKSFDSNAALFTAIAKLLGSDWQSTWVQQIAGHNLSTDRVFHVQNGPIVAYEADGYLGQYIVVVPAAHLVAVRQIARPKSYDGGPWPYGYDDFTRRVIALAQSYIVHRAP